MRPGRMLVVVGACITFVAPLVLATCADQSPPCFPGDELRDGVCAPAGAVCNLDAGIRTWDGGMPSGLGDFCTSDGGQCTGLEADHCEFVVMKKCVVKNCTLDPESCPEGWRCLDVRAVLDYDVPNLCTTNATWERFMCQ